MEIIHKWEDCPEHILINLEPSETQNANTELSWLRPILDNPNETGSATDNQTGEILKSNGGVWLPKIYSEHGMLYSPCFNLVKSMLGPVSEIKFTQYSCMNYLAVSDMFNVLFSAYKNGDYYKGHRDKSKLTLLVWLGEHNFTGGDILFNDFNYTINFKPNTAILFPSHYNHEVTKILTSSNNYVRYCLSAFIV